MKRIAAACSAIVCAVSLGVTGPAGAQSPETGATATPIEHLVVLFNENVSFDHYFATYPKAANVPGEPSFTAVAGTPPVNNLAAAHLLTNNPNFTNTANGEDAAEPFRLDRSQANTKSQSHAYTAEQLAYDRGKADLFPKYTGHGTAGGAGAFGSRGQVMGYFDGNTVTALWRYAQHFAMSDEAYTDTYGPSTPGAIEVISGQTNGMLPITSSYPASTMAKASYYVDDGQGGRTLINDVDPAIDVCSKGDAVFMAGRNIGDLLNDDGISWGGFMGGFDLDTKNANGTTACARSTHSDVVGTDVRDYVPHHNWFAYYRSTANASHARPSSVSAIGHTLSGAGSHDPANHEYDVDDFYAAVKAGNFPAVSYIKQPAYQDGHPGNSDPLDEQAGMVKLINFLEQQPDWKHTAVIVTYDDSDGWYDHAAAKVTSSSYDAVDQVDGPGVCGTGPAAGGLADKPVNGRCGPGTRIPFIVISPWAKVNAVSHTPISQASVVRFIEDNWLHGKRLGGGSFDATAGSIMNLFDFRSGGHVPPLMLDPVTGNPTGSH
jgi:phospholipase C